MGPAAAIRTQAPMTQPSWPTASLPSPRRWLNAIFPATAKIPQMQASVTIQAT